MQRSTPALFIDANVPIYADGRPHRLKDPCLRVLGLVFQAPSRFMTSTEVLQEVLHFSLSPSQSLDTIADFRDLMGSGIEPVYLEDIDRAVVLAGQYSGIEARDFVHAAVMMRLGIRRIVSADRRLSRIEA